MHALSPPTNGAAERRRDSTVSPPRSKATSTKSGTKKAGEPFVMMASPRAIPAQT